MLNMKAKKADLEKITAIMLRAASLLNLEDMGSDRLSLSMDLTACHVNGCPLDLDRLFEADEFDFKHDVVGIMYNINRKDGTLGNFFLPRYTAAQHVQS